MSISKISEKRLQELREITDDESLSDKVRSAARKKLTELAGPNKTVQSRPLTPEEELTIQIREAFEKVLAPRPQEPLPLPPSPSPQDREREAQAIEDRNMRVCAICYHLQSKSNLSCAQCEWYESAWLVPSQVRNDPEQAMLMHLSTLTAEEVRRRLDSEWARCPDFTTSDWPDVERRRRVARKILGAREAQRRAAQEQSLTDNCLMSYSEIQARRAELEKQRDAQRASARNEGDFRG